MSTPIHQSALDATRKGASSLPALVPPEMGSCNLGEAELLFQLLSLSSAFRYTVPILMRGPSEAV